MRGQAVNSDIKASQLDALCPYSYTEFKVSYLKNLKSFSIRVKELFEPIVCEEKGMSVCTFKKHFDKKPIFE